MIGTGLVGKRIDRPPHVPAAWRDLEVVAEVVASIEQNARHDRVLGSIRRNVGVCTAGIAPSPRVRTLEGKGLYACENADALLLGAIEVIALAG